MSHTDHKAKPRQILSDDLRGEQDGLELESAPGSASFCRLPQEYTGWHRLRQLVRSAAAGAQRLTHSPATLSGRKTFAGTASSRRFCPPVRARQRYAAAACWPGRRLHTQTRQSGASFSLSPTTSPQAGITQAQPGLAKSISGSISTHQGTLTLIN